MEEIGIPTTQNIYAYLCLEAIPDYEKEYRFKNQNIEFGKQTPEIEVIIDGILNWILNRSLK